MLALAHTGLDLVSLHIYPSPDNYRFGKPPGHLLAVAAKAASATRGVYLGEFGVSLPDQARRGVTAVQLHRDMLVAAAQGQVQLATYWTWRTTANGRRGDCTRQTRPPTRRTIRVLQAAERYPHWNDVFAVVVTWYVVHE